MNKDEEQRCERTLELLFRAVDLLESGAELIAKFAGGFKQGEYPVATAQDAIKNALEHVSLALGELNTAVFGEQGPRNC